MSEHGHDPELAKLEKEYDDFMKKKVTRRGVLEGAAVAGIALGGGGLSALLKRASERSENAHRQPSGEQPAKATETSESLMPSELSCIAVSMPDMKIDGFRQISSEAQSRQVLENMEKALKAHPADIVLTAEFSFLPLHEDNVSHDIVLDKVGDSEWEIGEGTTEFQKEMWGRLRELATQHSTHIMAATFPEHSEETGKNFQTMLHISPEGKIVGIKRKNSSTQVHPAEGNFTIQKNGKEYRVLPVICGEMSFPREDGQPVNGTIVHKWIIDEVEENGPYDILIHPQSQSDVGFGIIPADRIGVELDEMQRDYLARTENSFKRYYGEYFPYLTENGIIMTSDMASKAIMRKDGNGIQNYTQTTEFDSVES